MKKSHIHPDLIGTDTVIERFRSFWNPSGPSAKSVGEKVKQFILSEVDQARLEGCKHKETDYECPCFKDGFDTADAENGFNAKQMAKEARLEGAREERKRIAEKHPKVRRGGGSCSCTQDFGLNGICTCNEHED